MLEFHMVNTMVSNLLVGGLEHVFPYIENMNNPNCLVFFSRFETTNQSGISATMVEVYGISSGISFGFHEIS